MTDADVDGAHISTPVSYTHLVKPALRPFAGAVQPGGDTEK